MSGSGYDGYPAFTDAIRRQSSEAALKIKTQIRRTIEFSGVPEHLPQKGNFLNSERSSG
jgi:hypothetical protein